MVGIVRAQPMKLKSILKGAGLSVADIAKTVGCRADYLRQILNGTERGGAGLMQQLEQLERQLTTG